MNNEANETVSKYHEQIQKYYIYKKNKQIQATRDIVINWRKVEKSDGK